MSFMHGPVMVLRSALDGKVLRAPQDLDHTETRVLWDHVNENTFLKQPQLFGQNGRFVAHGGDNGMGHIYDCFAHEMAKVSSKFCEHLIRRVNVDGNVCNVVKVHPSSAETGFPVVACSGIDRSVKLLVPKASATLMADVSVLQNEKTLTSHDEDAAAQCARDLEEVKVKANGFLSRRPAFALDLYSQALCHSRVYHQTIHCRPVALAIALNASLAAFRCGAYDAGLRTAEYGHKLDPASAKALYRKAVCLRALRRLEEADVAVGCAKQLLPHDSAILELEHGIKSDMQVAQRKLQRACAALFTS
jgi:hypothetical protein